MRWVLIGMLLLTAARAVDEPPAARQSTCEVAANNFARTHPGGTFEDYMKHGFLYFGQSLPPKAPTTYRDPETSTMFYVESDGRDIAAIGIQGQLLWVRDPFVDRNMCPYRSAHPHIAWIGPPGENFGFKAPPNVANPSVPDSVVNPRIERTILYNFFKPQEPRPPLGSRFIGVAYDSSQYGYINIANGDFYPFGQN